MHKDTIFLFSKTAHPDVVHVPILTTTFFQPAINLDDYDAIVLTSKQAVTALEKISPHWRSLPVLSVASKTEAMVREAGGILLERGDGYGDSLDDIIVKKYAALRWLYPRPKVVASNFKERVKEQRVFLDDVVVYETACNKACKNISLPEEAVLIFTSPFTVECFLELFTFKTTYKIVVIGKTTAKALPKEIDYVMPDRPDIEACVTLAKQL